MKRTFPLLLCLFQPLLFAEEVQLNSQDVSTEWHFGVAKKKITPETPMLMSGYAARETPSTGKLAELWAKAVVVQDASGNRGAIVTADLIGISAKSTARIRNVLLDRHGLLAESVMICCSHTHTGPAISDTLATMNYFYATPEQREAIDRYTRELESTIVALVEEAIRGLQSGTLASGNGTATFATNRRENDESNVPSLRVEKQLSGPFDHDVPVLTIRDGDGKLRAVIFGYACHATVLSSHQWSGDYPGFAQTEVEKLHPGCLAMFWAGCGADQNPLPRRSVGLAQHYGRRLAVAVEEVLLTHEMKPVSSSLACENETLELAYAELPTRDHLERDMQSKNKFEAARARMLNADLEEFGKLPASYPYPVARWQLGEIEWLFLGGGSCRGLRTPAERTTGGIENVGCGVLERRDGLHPFGTRASRRPIRRWRSDDLLRIAKSVGGRSGEADHWVGRGDAKRPAICATKHPTATVPPRIISAVTPPSCQ